jgi:ABC-2 type transport system permease protein
VTTTPALILHQLKFDQKRFWRDPAGLFYAIGFPLIFLVVFLAIGGRMEEQAHIAGHALSNRPYHVAAITAMTIVSLTFVNLAISLTAARERGTLKRVRGTRLPLWVFVAGRIGTAISIAAAAVVLVAVAGRLAYGVAIPTSTLPSAVVIMLIATAAFCCLAFALTVVLPSAGTAAAVSMTLSLVLYFISGLFAREDNIPDTLRTIAGVFPVKPLFESLVVAYDPATAGSGFLWRDIAVLAGWGAAGLVAAMRYFRWTPSSG